MGLNGNTNWMETEAGQQIQQKLTEENTLRSIDHLIDRIGTLEQALEQLTTLMAQGPGLLSMLTDTIDETYRQAGARGIQIENRAATGIDLLEKLTRPETAQQINDLLTFSQQAPGLMAMAMDSFDDQMQAATQKGLDLQSISEFGVHAGAALSEAKTMEPAKVGGIFKLLKAIKDPDRQKALGFLMNFLKVLGQKL